jgi:Histidine kinase-, DNA gyrase B-, and HSP90-like ATPase
MSELVLQASDDLIARLAHESDPLKALVELIWNAVDAEAWTVTVTVEQEPALDGIAALHVEDDGHGVSVDEVESSFGRIGDSWKAHAVRSKTGVRGMHGSLGEGRLRAFALGSRVRWQSKSEDTAGTMHEVLITGSRANRTVFRWDAALSQDRSPGTIFSAFNDEQRSLGALQAEIALPALRSNFAPVLLNEPRLKISFDGVELDPAKEITSDTTLSVPLTADDGHGPVQLRVIEWRQGKHRVIYYGADAEHFTFEESGLDVENQFSYSAYAVWPGLRQRTDYLQLGELAPEPLNEVWLSARQAIRDHFNARRRERRREQVQQWKDSGVYPYQGEPDSEAEVAERTVFDVVSGTLSPQIAPGKNSARLTLALLRDAIRHDPERLTTILHEVVSLKTDDRDALTELLGETSLPAVIKSANLIASRNKFLLALEHLLFDPVDASTVSERDHLHHVLEHELWIFGEGYHMMNSERGLTQLLRTHLKLSGLPSKDVRPVKRWDGKTGRVDLHLAAKFQEHDRVRHLIVELKAPGLEIGRAELDQVEDYGNAILSNPQFSSATAQWDIILVGTDLHSVARNRIYSDDFELGRFWAPEPSPGSPRVTCYVRRWRELLDENRRRLDFLTSVMRHDPSLKEGLDYVRDRYADILPEGIGDATDDDE